MIKKLLLMSLVCFLIFLSGQTSFAQVSEEGGSGLLRVQRAMTSGRGQWTFGFFSRYFHQDLQTDAKEDIYNFYTNMNATFALTDDLEITGTIPAIGWIRVREDAPVGSLDNESFDEFAFGDVSAKLKLSLPIFTPRIRLAAEGFITLPTGKEDAQEYPNLGYASPFTSSTQSYGVRGLFSISTQHSGIWPMLIHANFGVRMSEEDNHLYYHSYPSPIISIPEGYTDYTNKLVDMGVGIEFPFFSHLNFFGEMHTEQLIDAEDLIKQKENPIYAGGGLKLPFAGKSELTLSAIFLLSKDDEKTAFNPEDSFPEWQAVAGLSFSAGLYGSKPKMKRQPPAEPIPFYEPVVTEAPKAAEEKDFFGELEPKKEETPVTEKPTAEETKEVEKEVTVTVETPLTEEKKCVEKELITTSTPPQNITNPFIVINVRTMPGIQPYQQMSFTDQEGKVYQLQPMMPQCPPGYMQMMPQGAAAACYPGMQPAMPAGAPTPEAKTQPYGMAPAQAAPDSLGDADYDGLPNYRDKCPMSAETYNGFMDDDGCPDAIPKDWDTKNMTKDTDGDGIADYQDKCVTVGEDWDGFEDTDGCPDLDNDLDGIPDKVDQCPLLAEVYNGITDGDCCPEEMPKAKETAAPEKQEPKKDKPEVKKDKPEEKEKPVVTPPVETFKDADNDGVQDVYDHCPTKAEDFDGYNDEDGCPDLDNDNDGILDKKDKCPNVEENYNNYKDSDGCPDVSADEEKFRATDQDGDGISDDLDRCPTIKEDWDGYQDEDGCPDLDNDNDGIKDDKDNCPNAPENFNSYQDKDGCPDTPEEVSVATPETPAVPVKPEVETEKKPVPDKPKEPVEKTETPAQAPVVEKPTTEVQPPAEPVKEEKIQPDVFKGEYIYFESNSAEITAESKLVLANVVSVMKKFADAKIEIAGYTDSSGSADLNRTLSEKRTVIVRDKLVEQGIAADRLSVKGYGEDSPIASNDTEAGKQKNRRVEFHLMP